MTLYLNEQKQVIKSPQKQKYVGNFKQENFYSEIQDFYKLLPWFKEKVNHIFVCPLNDNSKALVIEQDSVRDSDGSVFYRPNKKYYDLQLNALNKRQQETVYILTWADGTGVVYEFPMHVGIITDKGIFRQNEDIFYAQEQFLKHWKSNSRDFEKSNILQSPVDNNVKSYFEYCLKKNGIEDEKYLSQIIDVYVKNFGKTGALFIEKCLDLLIFLNPKLSLIHSTNFSKRFKKQHYKPKILPLLSEKDKLEEIFSDVLTPPETIHTVSDCLLKQRDEQYEEWINYLLVNRTGGLRKLIKPSKPKYVDLPSWKRVCKNGNDLVTEQDENIVYVQEGKDIYGFTIKQMFHLIKEKDCRNPYTKVIFSKEFVSKFMDTYYEPPANTIINRPEAIENITTPNALALLLDEQLSLLEKMCAFCKEKKYTTNIYLENLNQVLYFCSSSCLAQYNLKEFGAMDLTEN
jgi:hypothetical protein